MDEDARLSRLLRLPLLQSLPHAVLDKLVRIAHEEEYAVGDALFEEGDVGDSLYFIVSGAVTIQKRLQADPPIYTDVAISEEGDIIGEMALFHGPPRSATVRARRPLQVLRIYRGEFERFLNEDSASASAILAALLSVQSTRLREALQHIVTLHEIANDIASVQEVGELARRVMEHLFAVLPHVDAGAVCLWSPYLDECEVTFSRGIAAEDEPLLAIQRDGPVARGLCEQREPSVMTGIDEAHPLHRVFHIRDGDGVLLAPLVHVGTPVGFMLLAGRGQHFSSFHRILVGAVAAPLASAVVNVRYAQDEAARKRLQKARVSLARSSRRL